MALTPIQEMYWRLVRTSKVMAPELHRAAWRYASRTHDTSLMEALIKRDDAPGDLVARYGTLTDQALRAAYLSRKVVDVAQVAAGLAGERRAPVLAEALDKSNNHPAVVAVAVEAFLAKPTKALVHRIRRLPEHRMTPALAEAVLEVYDKTSPRERLLGLLDVVGMLGPDRARTLLPRLTHPDLVAQMLAHDVGNDLVVTTMRRIGPDWVEMYATNPNHHPGATDQVEALVTAAYTARAADPAVADVLAQLLAPHDPFTVDQLHQIVTGTVVLSGPLHRWREGAGDETRVAVTAAELADAAASVDVTTLSEYEYVAHAGSHDADTVAALAAAVAAAPTFRAWWTQTATVLLSNPLLTVEHRHLLIKGCVRALEPGRQQLSLGVDPIAMFPDDPVVAATWATAFPSVVLDAHGWEPFGGRHRSGDLVLTWAARDDERDKLAVAAAVAAGFDPAVLPHLPMDALQGLLRGKLTGDGASAMLGHLTGILAAELGDSPEAWALFERLVDTFPGTLAELLDTCQAAAA